MRQGWTVASVVLLLPLLIYASLWGSLALWFKVDGPDALRWMLSGVFACIGLATIIAQTGPAHALGNAGASLQACIDHVVEACNTTRRPAMCADQGTKACEKLHSKKSPGSGQSGADLVLNGACFSR